MQTANTIDNDHTSEDGPAITTQGDPSEVTAFAHVDEGSRFRRLLELVVPGDDLRINWRKRPLSIDRVEESNGHRDIFLTGNGTSYRLRTSRRENQAVLQYESGNEAVEHVRVTNRNAFNIWRYDGLTDHERLSAAVTIRGAHVDNPYEVSLPDTGEQRPYELLVGASHLETVAAMLDAYIDDARGWAKNADGKHFRWSYCNVLALRHSLARFRQNNSDGHGMWSVYGAEMGWLGHSVDEVLEGRVGVSDDLRGAVTRFNEAWTGQSDGIQVQVT